ERIRPTEILFHCEHEPTGPWWEVSRPMVTVQRLRAPREIFGHPLIHDAHRADIVRLEKLLSAGGIYLDADVFVHRSFDSLLKQAMVLGEERVDETVIGLCNAVILAEAQAPFLKRWYSEYRSFRSKGRDSYWDEHSVRIPYQLSRKFADEITILPHSAFFWPTFNAKGLAKMFESSEPVDVSTAYATHLWESFSWEQYLEHLTPGRVRSVPTNFHHWARPMIETLPDDYGALTTTARVKHGVRRQARRLRSFTHSCITELTRYLCSSAR